MVRMSNIKRIHQASLQAKTAAETGQAALVDAAQSQVALASLLAETIQHLNRIKTSSMGWHAEDLHRDIAGTTRLFDSAHTTYATAVEGTTNPHALHAEGLLRQISAVAAGREAAPGTAGTVTALGSTVIAGLAELEVGVTALLDQARTLSDAVSEWNDNITFITGGHRPNHHYVPGAVQIAAESMEMYNFQLSIDGGSASAGGTTDQ